MSDRELDPGCIRHDRVLKELREAKSSRGCKEVFTVGNQLAATLTRMIGSILPEKKADERIAVRLAVEYSDPTLHTHRNKSLWGGTMSDDDVKAGMISSHTTSHSSCPSLARVRSCRARDEAASR